MRKTADGVIGIRQGDGDPADMLNGLPVPAVVLAPDGEVRAWNGAAAELMGWTPSVEAPRLGTSRSRWLARLFGMVETEGTGVLVISRRRGGRRISVELRARHAGRRELLVLMRDVTTDRAAGAVVRSTYQRLRTITEAVTDYAIMTLNGSARIVSWNEGAERITGYAAAEIMAAPFRHLHGGGEEEIDEIFSAALTQRRSEREVTMKRRDGSLLRAHLTVIALRGPSDEQTGFTVIVRDLSERVQAEENLRRSEEQLRHSQKMDAVGRLAAGIAHDFNNVLTAIHGHVQFLLDDIPPEWGSRDDALEIKRAAERATELTRQLLTFARKQPSRPVPLDPNRVVADLEKLLRRLIRADVALETDLNEVPQIFADPGQLEQVLVNLVVNARDAIAQAGRITISTTTLDLNDMHSARVLSLAPGAYVQIAVSDTGCGMNAETQRQVFEPFYTTKTEGTGLGLSTVYGIVKQAGGHISVYSEPGTGSTFKVFLPAHGTVKARGGTTDTREDDEGIVLLVEDDDAVRALAKRTLESNGFVVLEAPDGEHALEIAASGDDIDVVVTDLTMPRVGGEELAARIRESRPDAGIVLMSGLPESTRRPGASTRDQLYLEKPFTPAALVSAVRTARRGRGDQSSTNST